jgi:hypothetical protein
MPYSINKTNGTLLTTVADGTIDQTTSLKLVGKNYAGYGEIQNENFVRLLENFADSNQPAKKITGQIWYDSSVSPGKLRFYDGSTFRAVNGSHVATSPPAGLGIGDFYWDSSSQQLYASNGDNTFTLVGPQGAAGAAITEMRTAVVADDTTVTHTVIEAVASGTVIFIISSDDEFTLGDAEIENYNNTFDTIYKGITLVNTGSGQNGATETTHRFHGTATSADGFNLSGIFVGADKFVRNDEQTTFEGLVKFNDPGFQVGTTPQLEVKIENSNLPIIQNIAGDTIQFKTKKDGIMVDTIRLVGRDLLPKESSPVSTLGNTDAQFLEVWATNFYGTATQAGRLQVDGGSYRLADTSVTPNTVAARDGAGDLYATTFRGDAIFADGADLAEKYLADDEYEIGTVVMVGGEKEVTACQPGHRAFGAVSGAPAYLMNDGLVGGTPVALKGRVPVKVLGHVKKGDRLVASSNGCAGVARILLVGTPVKASSFPDTFAIALESSDDEGVKLIESIII